MNEANELTGAATPDLRTAQDSGCPQCRLGNHYLCLNPTTGGCCCGGEPSRIRLVSPAQFPRPSPRVPAPTPNPVPTLDGLLAASGYYEWKAQRKKEDETMEGLGALFG